MFSNEYRHGNCVMNNRLMRGLYLLVGWLALALGLLGILLPLLPTTPFLLLAAFAFSRGSPRLYDWLTGHRRFGPVIRQWYNSGTIDRAIKHRALMLVILSFTLTLTVVPLPFGLLGKGLLLALCIGICYYLITLPETSTESASTRSNDE